MRQRKSHVERFLEGSAGHLGAARNRPHARPSIFTGEETCAPWREGPVAVVRGWGGAQLLAGTAARGARARLRADGTARRARDERLATDNREAVASEIRAFRRGARGDRQAPFRLEWSDAASYDMVLNTERLAVDDCVEEIEGLDAQAALRRVDGRARRCEPRRRPRERGRARQAGDGGRPPSRVRRRDRPPGGLRPPHAVPRGRTAPSMPRTSRAPTA